MSNRVEGSLLITGRLTPAFLDFPAQSIVNAAVSSTAGIGAEKLEHQHQITYGQPNTAAADETRILHHVRGVTGEILAFSAGSIAKAAGDATCTVDLKKNGTSVLSSVITLNSANTNRVAAAGTVSVLPLAAGDVLEVVIDGTIGTGALPTGVFCSIKIREDAD